MHILTKVGNQDNVVTYEHICDTLQDRDNIERRYITLGSTCLVLSGENDTIEVYMADSNKEWHDIAVAGGSGGGSSSGGLQLYICTASEVQDGKPAVEIPMEDVLYLVPGGTEGNLYTEYMYVNNNWELFGGATVDLTNYASKQWVQDQHYLNSYTETDPTVPAWAKAASKPTYTAAEVGALPNTTVVPERTSQLINNSGFISINGDPENFVGDEIPIYTIDVEGGTTTWDPVPFGELFNEFMQDYPLSINGDDITPIELENNYDTHGDYFVTPTYYLASIAGIGQRVPVTINNVDAIIGKPIKYHNTVVSDETFTNISKNVTDGITEITVGKDIYIEDEETHILVFNRRVPEDAIVYVDGTTPTIVAETNTQYICGEVSTLSFTPCYQGICDIIFTSGSTATVLTIPSSVRFPEWFDKTNLETNMTYEISIVDGTLGVVMAWPVTTY